MKNLSYSLVIGVILVFSGCDTSSVQGPQGPQGEPGNSNIKIYDFGGRDFSIGDTIVYVDSITADTNENSVWFVYFIGYGTNSSSTFSIPGNGYGAESYYYFRNIYLSTSYRSMFLLHKSTGPGEAYNKIRVVQFYVPNSEGRPQDMLPKIDYSNYEEVKRYYGLKD